MKEARQFVQGAVSKVNFKKSHVVAALALSCTNFCHAVLSSHGPCEDIAQVFAALNMFTHAHTASPFFWQISYVHEYWYGNLPTVVSRQEDSGGHFVLGRYSQAYCKHAGRKLTVHDKRSADFCRLSSQQTAVETHAFPHARGHAGGSHKSRQRMSSKAVKLCLFRERIDLVSDLPAALDVRDFLCVAARQHCHTHKRQQTQSHACPLPFEPLAGVQGCPLPVLGEYL